MTNPNEFDFTFYDQRLEEFESLLSDSKSHTLLELIKKAKDNTELGLQKLARLQSMTVVILAAQKITFNKNIAQYTTELNNAVAEMNLAKAKKIVINSMIDYYSNLVSRLQTKANQEKNLNDMSFKIYTLAISEFKNVLQLIYKPNNSSFHYESIVDSLEYVAGKIIPGLDEFKGIKKFAPSVRKKEFAKTGDKLMLYLEQFILRILNNGF